MASARRGWRLSGRLAAAMLMCFAQSAAALECTGYEFDHASRLAGLSSTAIAKVYASGKYEGAATVIDGDKGLMITAAHVVAKEALEVSFSHNGHQPRFRVERIQSLEPKLDLALIKIVDPPEFIAAPELWFADIESLNPNRKYTFYGYKRDYNAPLPGSEAPSSQGQCDYRLLENTYPGDSGSPVFSPNGLLAGVVVVARESSNHEDKARGIAQFIPMHCMSDLLEGIALDPEVEPIWSDLTSQDTNDLSLRLRPGANSKRWISNMALALTLDWAVEKRRARELNDERIDCIVMPAVVERKLGYRRLSDLIRIVGLSPITRAEQLHGAAIDLRRAGKHESEREVLRIAEALYGEFIAGSQNEIQSALRANSVYVGHRWNYVGSAAKLAPLPGLPTTALTNARIVSALQGRAQALERLAALERSPDLYWNATQQAVLAAEVSKANTLLAGKAWATAASASQKGKYFEVSIQAATRAAQNGFEPAWLKLNYAEAFRKRDNVRDPSKALGFAPLGMYVPAVPAPVLPSGQAGAYMLDAWVMAK